MTIDYLNPSTNFYRKEPEQHPGRQAGGTKVHTEPVKVLVTTDEYEIEGHMHIKPGGYQSRISDLLNMKELHYIPITDATFQKLRSPDEAPRQAQTLIINLDIIKMVVPLEKEKEKESEPQG